MLGQPAPSKRMVMFRKLKELGEDKSYVNAATTVAKILKLQSPATTHCGSHHEEETTEGYSPVSEKDVESAGDYTWVLSDGMAYRGVPTRQYDHKWIWEKNGRRWEESDYNTVLSQLRTL